MPKRRMTAARRLQIKQWQLAGTKVRGRPMGKMMKQLKERSSGTHFPMGNPRVIKFYRGNKLPYGGINNMTAVEVAHRRSIIRNHAKYYDFLIQPTGKIAHMRRRNVDFWARKRAVPMSALEEALSWSND